jgi:hypothetical protein
MIVVASDPREPKHPQKGIVTRLRELAMTVRVFMVPASVRARRLSW